jgi:transcriptional regulator with XRE-family HTH domain
MKRERDGRSDAAALKALAAATIRARKRRKWTQEDAASECGVALRTLQNLEAQRLNPGFLTLKAVADGFGLSLAELLRDV